MAKSANQKIKLLVLLQILEQQTDQDHPFTVQQIIKALAQKGIAAERKTIYDDMEALQQFGADVVVLRGKSNQYYLGERRFQLPELKLLVDAALSAKFITAKKSGELIRKISGFSSVYQAQLLQRQVHVQGRVKTMNEGIYYTVDTLQTAMAQGRQIQFKYYQWAVDKTAPGQFTQNWRQGGTPYLVSPWALVWDDENYYLIAYDAPAGILKHYRVDKMESIETLDSAREGKDVFDALDMGEYTKRTFGMFGGEETEVELCFANRLIGVVIDRFGKDTRIFDVTKDTFTVRVQAVPSPQFTAWVLGFGAEAEVLAPPEIRQNIADTLAQVLPLYQK
ncbi:WYL domain-containing protein [Ruminococcaceae bacterium OttesenSCG-928-A16]|nr:WYL domain-containing protein [Ruminococcaceae bacterium OttesenSCG-928-A16]